MILICGALGPCVTAKLGVRRGSIYALESVLDAKYLKRKGDLNRVLLVFMEFKSSKGDG